MRRVAAALVSLLLSGAPARAAEFLAGWEAHTNWDSNILRTATQPESAFSLRTGPDIRVREGEGDLQYDAVYHLRYDAFAQVKGINTFDQIANGSLSWRVTPLTDFTLSDDFGYVTNLNGAFEFAPDAVVGTVVPNRERVTYNTGNATLTHRLSQLWELRADLSNDFYNYRSPLQNDSLSTVGSVQVTRALSPLTVVGGGASYTRQEFGATVGQPGGGSTFIQGYGVLSHAFSPTFSLTAQAGPALTMPDQINTTEIQVPTYFAVNPATCANQLPDGTAILSNSNSCLRSISFNLQGQPVGLFPQATTTVKVPFIQTETVNDSINYFGSLSVHKNWRQWDARLSYTRQASGASGIGTSTTLDAYSGNLSWRPTRDWQVTLVTSYATQVASSAQPEQLFVIRPLSGLAVVGGTPVFTTVGDPVEVRQGKKSNNAFEVKTLRAEMRAYRQFGRHLTVDAGVSWWQQESSSDFFAPSTRDAFRVDIGFVWNFAPIPL